MLRAIGTILTLTICLGCAPDSRPPRLGLKLPPATFGASVSLQQHLTVEREGRIDELEAALEIDSERIALVLLAWNQRVLSFHYDGRSLESWRHPEVPAEVRVEDVLEDLQLTLWPVEELRAVLPASWRIEEKGGRRIVTAGALPVAEIHYSDEPRWQGKIELNNFHYRYRLTIESF